MSLDVLRKSVAFNVAIAVKHIVIRTLDFDLVTCWMKLIDEKAIQ